MTAQKAVEAAYEKGHAEGYDLGFADGESSCHATWFNRLVDVLPEDIRIDPSTVAEFIDQLQRSASSPARSPGSSPGGWPAGTR